MKMRFEILVHQILPVVRSFVAKELVFSYKLSQAESAKLMGVTQPAVSQYLNNVRGKARMLERKEVVEIMQALARDVYEGKADEARFMTELYRIYMVIEGGIGKEAVNVATRSVVEGAF